MVDWKKEQKNKELERKYNEIMSKQKKVSITKKEEESDAGKKMEEFKEENRKCEDCQESLCFGINGKWLCAGCPYLPDEFNRKNGEKKS